MASIPTPAVVATLALLAVPARAQAPTAKGRTGLALDPLTTKWTGDFDGMVERRLIRVLTVYSKTLYFIDHGTPRGTANDQGKLLEDAINKKTGTGLLKVDVQFVPMSRDELIPALLEGRGDIIMADMTVTPERLKQVTFTEPWIAGVDEIVVTSPDGPAIDTLDDLSGKEVFVRQSSSYYQSLLRLNERLTKDGKPPVSIVPAPEALEDEDLLEMANAGLVKVLVVDNHKAWFWQRVWPNLKLHPTVTLRTNGEIAWAIRPDSPGLLRTLNGFLAENGRDSLNARMIFRRYLLNTQYVKSSKTAEARFRAVVAMFRKYGQQYNMDWMLMAAQGYQESRLNQSARSHVGAIGVMQLMPATGVQMKVGDIRMIEPNIHAGAKYMSTLMTQYFPDAHFSEGNRPLFAFASYNAGAGNIARMRKEAAKRGLDPDRWFNNVEIVVAEKIGLETTQYVRNIYKYYASYRLTVDAQEARRRALEEIQRSAAK
jgi:membrane-bound lytic murein transglycosylase MltF